MTKLKNGSCTNTLENILKHYISAHNSRTSPSSFWDVFQLLKKSETVIHPLNLILISHINTAECRFIFILSNEVRQRAEISFHGLIVGCQVTVREELHHHIFRSFRTVSIISLLVAPPANRFSPSKRARNSISALKSSSQEVLSPQKEEKAEERTDRLGGARSLASLDGQGGRHWLYEKGWVKG